MSTLLRTFGCIILAIVGVSLSATNARADTPIDTEWIVHRITDRRNDPPEAFVAHFKSVAEEIRGSKLALDSLVYFLRDLSGQVPADELARRGLRSYTDFAPLVSFIRATDPGPGSSFLYLAMQAELLSPDSFSLAPFFEVYFHETVCQGMFAARWLPEAPEEVSKRLMASFARKIIRKGATDLQASYADFYRELSEAVRSGDAARMAELVGRKHREILGGLRRYFLSDRFAPLPFHSSEAAAIATSEMHLVLALDLAEEPKFHGDFRKRFLGAIRAGKDKLFIYSGSAFEGKRELIARIRPLREKDPEIDYWVRRSLLSSVTSPRPSLEMQMDWMRLLFEPRELLPGTPGWKAFADFIVEFKSTVLLENQAQALDADPLFGPFSRTVGTDAFTRYSQALALFHPEDADSSVVSGFRELLRMLRDPAGPYLAKRENGEFKYPAFRRALLSQAMLTAPSALLASRPSAELEQVQDLSLVVLRILVDDFFAGAEAGDFRTWTDAAKWTNLLGRIDRTDRTASIVVDGIRYEASAPAIYMKAFTGLDAKMRAAGAGPDARTTYSKWLFEVFENNLYRPLWDRGRYLRMRARERARDRLFAAIPPPPPNLVGEWGDMLATRLAANIREISTAYRLSPETPIEDAINQETIRLAQIESDFRFLRAHRREFGATTSAALAARLGLGLIAPAKSEIIAAFAPELYADLAESNASLVRTEGRIAVSFALSREFLESLVVLRARLDGNGTFSPSAYRALYARLGRDLAALGASIGDPSAETLKAVAEQCALLARKAE